ncbi:MAG TPA: UDP-3-O-acyl-N-acetylglucosamine deacetylase, partial [Phycisphaerae bacterium]|nr:UDP-3-O-acyl-N-acetylglucosamine deacetylase [Phycisphaerae bacterium]
MQKTIKTHAVVEGRGLFNGTPGRVRFCPAPEDTGIVFVRTDTVSPVEIPADIDYVVDRLHRTTSLAVGEVSVETVEHVLSAIWGLDIDNLRIEVDNPEIPNVDGSSLPYAQALKQAGLEEQDMPKDVHLLDEPIVVSEGDMMLTALPGSIDSLDLLYDMEYPVASIGRQLCSFRLGKDDYIGQLASARTF